MQSVRHFFEANYSSLGRYWWKHDHAYSINPEDHRASLLTRHGLLAAQALGPGAAIDLGAGEGADSIRLAKMGWDVVAVEPTESGVEKIRRFSSDAGVQVQAVQSTVEDYETERSFDLVICNGVLHYIEEKQRALRSIQGLTRPGGCNIVSLWSAFRPVPECHQIVPTHPDPEDGVVVAAYESWDLDLLYFERERFDGSHDGMPDHRHSYIKLIAFKPV